MNPEAKRTGWLRTGRLMPLLILSLLLADGLMRLLPLRFFAFRAWEALSTGEHPHTVFPPDQHVHSPRCFGDLASIANRRDLRQYHVEDFTTDALGFRNPPGMLERGPISVLLNGNSFAAGVGVSDDETLGAQLGKRLGTSVYTIAGVPTPRFADIVTLQPMLRMSRGVVVHAYLEGYSIASPGEQQTPAYRFDLGPRSHFVESLGVSRLAILSMQLKKWLRPGWHEGGVVARTLRNGETMLFPELDPPRYRDESLPAVAPWLWLNEHLRERGLQLVVVLVPNKYGVYAPLLRRPEPPRPSRRLDRFAEALRAGGVQVIDLAEVFERRAAEELDRGGYLYWKDDTHWNAQGIQLAADEIAKAWPAREPDAGDGP